jgi:hypothetical protein
MGLKLVRTASRFTTLTCREFALQISHISQDHNTPKHFFVHWVFDQKQVRLPAIALMRALDLAFWCHFRGVLISHCYNNSLCSTTEHHVTSTSGETWKRFLLDMAACFVFTHDIAV